MWWRWGGRDCESFRLRLAESASRPIHASCAREWQKAGGGGRESARAESMRCLCIKKRQYKRTRTIPPKSKIKNKDKVKNFAWTYHVEDQIVWYVIPATESVVDLWQERRGEERRGTVGKMRVVAWWRASQQLKTVSTLLIKAVDVYAPG